MEHGHREPLGPPLITHVEAESIAASPDGRTVALAGFDHSVSLRQLNRARWPDRACRIANRNLTPEEWQYYLEGETYHQTCPEQ